MTSRLYAQGDIILELVEDVTAAGVPVPRDPDGAVVLARGELTGHRHAFHSAGVTLFRDYNLAPGVAPDLYIGHVRVSIPVAELRHQEHATISLPTGTYRVRRQREWEGDGPQLIWE